MQCTLSQATISVCLINTSTSGLSSCGCGLNCDVPSILHAGNVFHFSSEDSISEESIKKIDFCSVTFEVYQRSQSYSFSQEDIDSSYTDIHPIGMTDLEKQEYRQNKKEYLEAYEKENTMQHNGLLIDLPDVSEKMVGCKCIIC